MTIEEMESKKLGTKWTGDGEGATVYGITRAVHGAIHAGSASRVQQAIDEAHDLLHSLWTPIGRGQNRRTNLALTGSPLTEQDIARILSPEFRVGKSATQAFDEAQARADAINRRTERGGK